MQFAIFKNKKSQRYYKFVQFYEDGYGEFEDKINNIDINEGLLPDLFPLQTEAVEMFDPIRKERYVTFRAACPGYVKDFVYHLSNIHEKQDIEKIIINIELGRIIR